MSTQELSTLRLERVFAASPADVFDAWTEPEVLARWWGAQPSSSSPGCDVDLRVGGRYTLRMLDAETGDEHVVGGEYREVLRPRKLVYTWCWAGDSGLHPGHVSTVTVEFRDHPDGTLVVLEHAGLPSQESRSRHANGWQGALANLGRRVFPETAPG